MAWGGEYRIAVNRIVVVAKAGKAIEIALQ
jgi:hypothetical protein